MTRALLEAHPDLVRHLDPDATRRCPVPVHYGGSTWRCSQPARWQVQGQPSPTCGIHAARTLRRELQDATDAGAGS